jgi:hypothetical protein
MPGLVQGTRKVGDNGQTQVLSRNQEETGMPSLSGKKTAARREEKYVTQA